MNADFKISPRQKSFIEADADEVLFGGAAGGGKSYGQLLDAFRYAFVYKNSKQLILRRTYKELERSLIRVALEIYPKGAYTYNDSKHTMIFQNGSLIDFGYCDTTKAVYQYQSSEYDMIRFDELTHFEEFQYIYLLSRLRGALPYPRQMKSSTNPGGVGHHWVKARFIDPAPPDTEFTTKKEDGETGTRIFLPSKLQDNIFLQKADPRYRARLENLPEAERKALLYGDWDIFQGQYFTEFNREIHVIEPFEIPKEWRRYVSIDYGLDMLAVYWTAFDTRGRGYVYKELCAPDLPIYEAAQAIKTYMGEEEIYQMFAPPDLWGRERQTGKTQAQLFYEHGLTLSRAKNDRVAGWMNMKEWMRPYRDEAGEVTANLRIFSTCRELIRCIPALIRDEKNPSDCSTQPHDITHSPDSIRYLLAGWPAPAVLAKQKKAKWEQDQWEDYNNATGQAQRDQLIKMWGNPF